MTTRDATSGAARPPLIEKYRARLPLTAKTPIISLGEGGTPLIRCRNLERELAAPCEIHVKYEGMNPTGSFKDRGMTMAISKAVEEGARAVICASTGNTSASAAAYSARAGLRCIVLIPEGKIAMGKLAQAMVQGAQVVQVQGNFDEALEIVREISESHAITLVNSLNPYRIEGQKTGSFEIVEDLAGPPDFHFIPVGNAGNITAYWRGYRELRTDGTIDQTPRMMGFQAAGSAPIVLGHPVENPETIATAIRIGKPASWKQAEAARDESGGVIEAVTDDEILAAYQMLAAHEGVFVEPASAASIAGLRKKLAAKAIPAGTRAVCIVTGHGLKDPDRAIAVSVKPEVRPATAAAVIDLIERA
ncbi:MAG: threonine synthase [Candidatus Eisenbacteria bacterium]